MSVNNRIGSKIKAEKFEPETTSGNKIDDIKDDHTNNIYSLDMTISVISLNNAS